MTADVYRHQIAAITTLIAADRASTKYLGDALLRLHDDLLFAELSRNPERRLESI